MNTYYCRSQYGSQGGIFIMAQLSELDVQNLRHLIGGSETCHAKFSAYAEEATDSQIKQYFQQAAQSAKENKQQLMGFLK